LSNTGELPRTSYKAKPPGIKEDPRGGTFYRIKKTNFDKLRKDKKKKKDDDSFNADRGIEETFSVTAKRIGKPPQVVHKNIDIHIGNVNTYNIFLNGEQRQTIVQSQTPKMSRGVSPPEVPTSAVSEAKKNRRPLRNVQAIPNIHGKQIGVKQPSTGVPLTMGDTKSSFKIGKIKRNNLIPKEESAEENSIPNLLQKPAAIKYKPYQYEPKRMKRRPEEDLGANPRQPSPLDSKIRGVPHRLKKL
jgi:hypothetical protein